MSYNTKVRDAFAKALHKSAFYDSALPWDQTFPGERTVIESTKNSWRSLADRFVDEILPVCGVSSAQIDALECVL